ncbi:MAG: hypothetical protein DRO12_03310 [Thermoprotei archaeon]|nr:MAG: hypothetical protein DRO12_03310 [Thermoprotei archaeon]
MDINPLEYKDLFLSEAKDNITKLNELLLKLEKVKSAELVDEIFRIVHSLKSSSAAIGLDQLSLLMHSLEDLLTIIKEGKIDITSDIVDMLLKGIDLAESMILAFEENNPPPDAREFIEEIKRFTEHAKSSHSHASVKDESFKLYSLTIKFSEDCTAPRLKMFTILKEVEEHGVLVKVHPDPASENVSSYEYEVVLYIEQGRLGELEKNLNKVEGVEEVKLREVKPEEVGVDSATLEELIESRPSSTEIEELVKKFEESLEKEESATLKVERESGYARRRIEEIKVKVKDLDMLLDVVGELVLIKSRLSRLAKESNVPSLKEVVSSFERTINTLQGIVMGMRLIPIGQVLGMLPRMVRDLSKELGKEVDLIIEGKDIALDRRILEEIIDPLMHIVRNAIDHGIESPEERVKSGKPRVGTIIVRAKREGDYVIIEVEDDGKGIDPKEVKKIAVEKGLISPSAAEKMSDEEAFMLITLPGFSTRKKASMVSGRGMGMSAVKEKIESIGGSLEIWSVPGRGTRVSIRLPPSLAIVSAVLVRSCGNVYAIPTTAVSGILKFNGSNIKLVAGNEVLVHRGRALPLVRLSSILKCDRADDEHEILLIDAGHKSYALAVEAVEGLEDVVTKPVNKFIQGIKEFSGVTILGDGKVCMILDPYSLV